LPAQSVRWRRRGEQQHRGDEIVGRGSGGDSREAMQVDVAQQQPQEGCSYEQSEGRLRNSAYFCLPQTKIARQRPNDYTSLLDAYSQGHEKASEKIICFNHLTGCDTSSYLAEDLERFGSSTMATLLGSGRARRYFITGGAGFIGSHFTDRLLSDPTVTAVTLYDNFSSGREWHYEHHKADTRLTIVRANIRDIDVLAAAMAGHEVVIHLASNPDIARAAHEPEIDFYEGTLLTNNVVEAMRRSAVGRILYASGTGVYGDLGSIEAKEDHGPLMPVSTYGASKLAGEALISSYCFMFGLSGCAFRFGNVVGARQTHGVGFDFVRRLRADPSRLSILGDGKQSKSYIHVSDVVEAVLLAEHAASRPFSVFNVATGDYITVTEIAELAVECLGLRAHPRAEYSGGARGWKGDVPIARLNTDRIRKLGWTCRYSTRDALRASLMALIADDRTSRL
jgi:UDP-glucose 4-epimerase